MWNAFAGNDASKSKKHRSTSRSRSPQPPVNPPAQKYSPTVDAFQNAPVIPSPTYGQFLTAPDISRGRTSSPQPYPVLTHVVHVIHHTSHKSHKKHSHSHSHSQPNINPPASAPIPTPSPITPDAQAPDYFAHNYSNSSTYASSQAQVYPPAPPPSLAFPTPHAAPGGLHFSYSEPTQLPTQRTLLKKPRPANHSHSQSYSTQSSYSQTYQHTQTQAQAYPSSTSYPQHQQQHQQQYPSQSDYPWTAASHAVAAQPETIAVRPSRSHSHQPQSHSHSHSHSHSKDSSARRPQKQTYVPKPSKAAQHPAFEYSKCTGRRRALCIGINYLGQPNELRGCINDAKHVREFLRKQGNYRSSEIMILTDDASDPRLHPTRANIIAAMQWLVKGACPHDALFFHYSGHGGQTPDQDGDEADGYDEVIYPLDFKVEGHITDDEMHEIMVRPLPHGCRLTALFDACHSGTVLDLPYIYSAHGRLKGSHVSPQWVQRKATPADVISWSGCTDEQTSADTFQGGVAVGAMSYAFMTSLKAQPVQTYQQLLASIRHILNPRYSQKPQLGSSHHIDTNLQFIF